MDCRAVASNRANSLQRLEERCQLVLVEITERHRNQLVYRNLVLERVEHFGKLVGGQLPKAHHHRDLGVYRRRRTPELLHAEDGGQH